MNNTLKKVWIAIGIAIGITCFLIFVIYCVSKIISIPNHDGTISGKVVDVTDGDTIKVLSDRVYKIRLAEIDAPEKKQAYGTQSKEELSKKILHKNVKVFWEHTHRDRFIGKVYLGERYINKEMIKEGWAWHYSQYSKSDELHALEYSARYHHLGLWKDKNPVPPWEYRHKKK